MSQAFSIIICTHNRADLLARTLEGMTRLRLPPGCEAELIVVLNACEDNSSDIAAAWLPRQRFAARAVEEPERGLSAARNRGVREARHDLILFTDDDVLIDPEWAIKLLDIYAAHGDRAGVVGGRVELWWDAVRRPDWLPRDLEWILAAHDKGDAILELRTPDLFGANFSFRRAVFADAGPFRTELGRKGENFGGFEEYVFIKSAIRAGWRAFYTPESVVHHWVQPKRVDPAYFTTLIGSYARQRLLLPEPLGLVRGVRVFCGAIARVVLNIRAAGKGAAPLSDQHDLRRRVNFASGVGTLRGLWGRLFRG
jgi:glucosyl-dolichyl phosphate glucuronosyltransferase